VSSSANWGFGYYWPHGQPGWYPSTTVAVGFRIWFPGQPEIVVARNRDSKSIDAAVTEAVSKVAPNSTIWFVRQHVGSPEDLYWKTAVANHGLRVTPALNCSLWEMVTANTAPDRSPGLPAGEC
jgi:hypothetical protein